MATRTAYTPMQALVKALHKVQPPVLQGGVTISQESGMVETVVVTFHMTPELVKEWGEECSALAAQPRPAAPPPMRDQRFWTG